LRKAADTNLSVKQQGQTYNHKLQWAYESNHLHSSDERLSVVHVNVNLHR